MKLFLVLLMLVSCSQESKIEREERKKFENEIRMEVREELDKQRPAIRYDIYNHEKKKMEEKVRGDLEFLITTKLKKELNDKIRRRVKAQLEEDRYLLEDGIRRYEKNKMKKEIREKIRQEIENKQRRKMEAK